MATVSNADLTKNFASGAGVSAKDAKTILDAFLEQTIRHLSQSNTVQLTGFGTFEVRTHKTPTDVKPGTSEKMQIRATKYPAFKPDKTSRTASNKHWGRHLDAVMS